MAPPNRGYHLGLSQDLNIGLLSLRALVINPRLRLPQTRPRRPKTQSYPLPHASTASPSRATSVIASATCAHWTLLTVDRALKSRTWSGRAVRQMTWDESSAFGFLMLLPR